MREERIAAFDFVRVMAAFGVMAFHFFIYTACPLKLFLNYRNGGWGNVCSTVFFILSGALLGLRDTDISSVGGLRTFYRKRWRSIFPMYYAAYAWGFARMVRDTGRLFYNGKPWLLIQTALGLDGYLVYRFPDNYYILGEWFTGAIVLLYLCFPLILRVMRRSEKAAAAAVLSLYAGMLLLYRYGDFFLIDDFKNLISCLLSFWMGMEIAAHKALLDDGRVSAFCWAGAVILALVKVPLAENILTHLMGLFCFVVLCDLGKWLTARSEAACSFVRWLGGLSFGIFLMHHATIREALAVRNPASVRGMFLMLGLIAVCTLVRAWILKTVTDALLNGATRKKL